ncbi:hypothetical protein ANTPLA_LOCUS663 [Anthophora plagiata]
MATDEAQERLKFLIRKRSGIKSHITIFEKYLRSYEQQPDPVMLRNRFQRLKEIYSAFEDIQAEIEVLQEEGEHETEHFEAEERYIEASVQTEKWLTETNLSDQRVAVVNCNTPTPSTSGLQSSSGQRARRLETTTPRTPRGTNGQSNSSSPRASPTFGRRQIKKLPNISSRKNSKVFVTTTPLRNCVLCKDKTHTIHRCEEFYALSVGERINAARKEKLCSKCLRTGHSTQECTLSQCRICNLPHNPLLHLPRSGRRSPTPPKKRGSTTATASTSET